MLYEMLYYWYVCVVLFTDIVFVLIKPSSNRVRHLSHILHVTSSAKN